MQINYLGRFALASSLACLLACPLPGARMQQEAAGLSGSVGAIFHAALPLRARSVAPVRLPPARKVAGLEYFGSGDRGAATANGAHNFRFVCSPKCELAALANISALTVG